MVIIPLLGWMKRQDLLPGVGVAARTPKAELRSEDDHDDDTAGKRRLHWLLEQHPHAEMDSLSTSPFGVMFFESAVSSIAPR